jgi:hypothetical protein
MTPHGQPWLKVGDKSYCLALRERLCRLSFNQDDAFALRDLIRFLADAGEIKRIKQFLKFGSVTSGLACFGIHRCSGCGGDPVWLKETHGYDCKGCAGTGWMHEVDDGVVYFTHGMFGPTDPHPKGTAKWKVLWG